MSNSLYKKQAAEFSKTRTAPWDGWNEIPKLNLINKASLRILDIGCGNGRFLKFSQRNFKIDYYLGIDNSKELLTEARLIGGEYENIDVNNLSWKIKSYNNPKFDLIVAFGLQHHLTSFEIRLKLLEEIFENLSDNGIAIVTYWQFLEYERYMNKIKRLDAENDYIMSFNGQEGARFCHYTSIQEIKKLETESRADLIKSFRADGRNKEENIYRIYSKNK